MTTFLLPLSKRCFNNVSFLSTQRYIYKMTVVPSLTQCKKKLDTVTTFKRNAINWPNPLKNSQTKYETGMTGTLIYEKIADQINYAKFFKELEMDDTFLSWFLVTELHVWMLALRIMQDNEYGPRLRNCLIEAMWKDVKIRGKILGVTSSSLMKSQLQLLSEQFNASLVGYDEGIMSNDAILANHLWKRFFKCKTNNPVHLEQLIKYIRKQVNLLSKAQTTDIFSLTPSVHWINL